MAEQGELPIETIVELARLRGLNVDAARAERMRGAIESLRRAIEPFAGKLGETPMAPTWPK